MLRFKGPESFYRTFQDPTDVVKANVEASKYQGGKSESWSLVDSTLDKQGKNVAATATFFESINVQVFYFS